MQAVNDYLIYDNDASLVDNLQNKLDVFGNAPVGGEAFDLLNAAIYAMRGKYLDSSLSLGSATPFLGNQISVSRAIKKVYNAAESVSDEVKVIDDAVHATKGVTQAELEVAITSDIKGAGKGTDFYVTPKGDVVPATKEGFNNNLSKMTNENGKYVGEGSNGPVRVRVEDAHPEKPAFSGHENSDHEVPHIHIEHKKNGSTGPWGKGDPSNKTTFPQDWLK